MVFLLAAFGMVCWGIAPIFAKMGLSSTNALTGLAIRSIFTVALVVSWVVCSGNASQLKDASVSSWTILGIEAIFATLLGDLAYFSALKKGDATVVSIIMSSSPLVTILCSMIFLGEQITFLRVVGSCLIILGIVLVL